MFRTKELFIIVVLLIGNAILLCNTVSNQSFTEHTSYQQQFSNQSFTEHTSYQQKQEQSKQQSQQHPPQQYNKQRLQQINFLIKSYFNNCKLDQQSNMLLYGCSILKQNYAQFLYALYHKQLILDLLKLYHLQQRVNESNQLQYIQQIGQRVHSIAVAAFNDWIQIYKPNKQITIQEMYADIPDLQTAVLDVIQHNPTKHHDMINLYKQIYQLQQQQYKKYIIMGNKTEQQMAQDYAGILSTYFGEDCINIKECSMPLNRYVFFVKQLSFYITPLVDQNHKQNSILVSEDMDYKATQFLINQVDKLKPLLGRQVDYEQIQTYSEDIATNLFQYLKKQYEEQKLSNTTTTQHTQQSSPQHDKLSHQDDDKQL